MGIVTEQIAWERHYPQSPPIGWFLRERYPDRWLRFHSLPGSKRYPEGETDRVEILRRHNAVGNRLFDVDVPVVLIQGQVDTTTHSSGWKATLTELRAAGFASANTLCFKSEVIPWCPGQFDTLLLEVADLKKTMVVFFSPAKGNVFAPYDGGGDLFLPDQREREGMRAYVQGWLSNHPAGL